MLCKAHTASEDTGRICNAHAAARVAWRQIAHVIEENVVVCRWVGLAVLLVQVACMGLAYALSSAQQRLLLDASMCALGSGLGPCAQTSHMR